MVTLLDECLEVLNDYEKIEDENHKKLEIKFHSLVKFTSWGRINWDILKDNTIIDDIEKLKKNYGSLNFYIIWGEIDLPIIKCEFSNIIDNLDDVLAVSFDTWLLSYDKKIVIEFYHDGEITVGRL